MNTAAPAPPWTRPRACCTSAAWRRSSSTPAAARAADVSPCGACRKTGKCVRGGGVNEAVEALKAADGLIVGSPVHYASPAGELLAFLDRMFYSGAANFAHKPAACIVSARRAGTTASVDVINKYFTISQMPVVSSTYWPMVHGATPEDVEQDADGLADRAQPRAQHGLADKMHPRRRHRAAPGRKIRPDKLRAVSG